MLYPQFPTVTFADVVDGGDGHIDRQPAEYHEHYKDNHHPLIRRDTPAQAAEFFVRPVLYISNDLRHKFPDHAVSV